MKVVSIFNSIDGEVNKYHQGCFSTFIRFSGCNLYCDYCDTKWSWNSGTDKTPQQIFDEIKKIGCKKITITGGEPLLQDKEKMLMLLNYLDNAGYLISVETNGTLPIPKNWPVDSWVVDYKSSSVGHTFERQCNYQELGFDDWVKFLVGSREEYEEILPVLKESKFWNAMIAVSTMHGQLDPAILVDWLKKDKLFHCVVDLQLHKYIWPNIGATEER